MKLLQKTVATLAIFALLLTGCAPAGEPAPNLDGPILLSTQPSTSTNPTLDSDTTPTLPLTPDQALVPMSAAWKQQVEEDWTAATGSSLGVWENVAEEIDGIRYYGTYAGYDILFRPGSEGSNTNLTVEDVSFPYAGAFDILAYRDGRFATLKELCSSGVLSDGQIRMLSLTHMAYQGYLADGAPRSDTLDVIDQMKLAFLRQYVSDGRYTTADLSVTDYGEYGGAQVGFVNGILAYTMALTQERVGDVVFQYRSGQTLLVYFEGELMRLGEAYDRGILTREDLLALRDAYAPKNDNYVTE